MAASFIARAPQLRDRIGVSVDGYGLLLTMAALGGLVGSVLAGRIVHDVGTRRVIQAGAFVMVIALPVIGSARSPLVWLVAMVAYLFADVLVDISMNLQGSWISARRHTPVMHRLHGVWSLGTLAGGMGAVVANAAGLSTASHLLIVAVVMAVALGVATPRLLSADEDGHADDQPDPAGHGDPTLVVASGPARFTLSPVLLLVVAGMFAVVAEVTGGEWASFRLTDDFGASAAWGSAAFVAFTVGMTSMRMAGDSLQMRLGRTGLHRSSVSVAAIGFVLASLVDQRMVAVAGLALVGAGVATFMPKLYDDAARLPGRRGAGMGAMTGGMRVAYLVTPVAVGGLAGTSLSVGASIAAFTLPAVVGMAAMTELTARRSGASAADAVARGGG